MSNREVVVVSGARTAIGGYGGSLKDMPPTRLGAIAIRETVSRAGVDPASERCRTIVRKRVSGRPRGHRRRRANGPHRATGTKLRSRRYMAPSGRV